MSLGGATQTQITTYIDTEVTAFGTDLQTLVDGILTKTGAGAKIIVADLPNFAAIPVGQAQSAPVQALLQAVSVTGIDQGVYEVGYGEGLYTVDLLCDPNSYVTSNFYTDGFHPNSAGYALLAQKYLAQITAATPQTIPPTFSCSDAAITAVNRSDEAVHTLRYLEPR